MKITGVVAEYNPFHNGHKYQLQDAVKQGATHIVCVMSGNFTQRGDAAVMDKLARTRCALAGGADLVLELPAVYALGSAGVFAAGAVNTLLATGCLDALHFGSECGDIEALRHTATAVELLEMKGLLDTKSGSSAAARSLALREHGYADAADVLDSPNNLLGVEYLLNLRAAYSHVLPETVARIGTAHDSRTVQGEFCSASQIRRFLQSDLTGAAPYLPAETLEILKERQLTGQAPIYLKPLETAILSRLRMMDQAYLSRIAGVSEGLENRLYQAIRTHHSLEEIATAVKTKRYPLSRIRRILLCAAIGITAKDQTAPPAYLRVLGQNQKGNEILRLMKHSAKLPIVLRSSDFDGLSPAAHRMFRLENLATDLYTMAYTPMGECGTEYTRNLYSYTKGEGK